MQQFALVFLVQKMSTTTCDVSWAAAFLTGLFNLNGAPPSKPVLHVEKNGDKYDAWLTSSGKPLLMHKVDTKGIECMEANGYQFVWRLDTDVLHSNLSAELQKVHIRENAKNFYDALKQCNVETEITYSTKNMGYHHRITLPWKDAV